MVLRPDTHFRLQSMAEDSDGNIWITTVPRLFKLDVEALTWFDYGNPSEDYGPLNAFTAQGLAVLPNGVVCSSEWWAFVED